MVSPFCVALFFYLPISHPNRLLLQVQNVKPCFLHSKKHSKASKKLGFPVQKCIWRKNVFSAKMYFCLHFCCAKMFSVHFVNKMFSISKNLGSARVGTWQKTQQHNLPKEAWTVRRKCEAGILIFKPFLLIFDLKGRSHLYFAPFVK